MFLGGLTGVIHEEFWTAATRPELLILYAAMMGIPGAIGAIRSRK